MYELRMLVGIFFIEGRAAANDGLWRESNPYRDSYGEARQAWFDGWDDVAAERRSDRL